MEEFIKEIEKRIKELQSTPTPINIGKVSELTLVLQRLKTLSIGNSSLQLKEKYKADFEEYLKGKNIKKTVTTYKYRGEYYDKDLLWLIWLKDQN